MVVGQHSTGLPEAKAEAGAEEEQRRKNEGRTVRRGVLHPQGVVLVEGMCY